MTKITQTFTASQLQCEQCSEIKSTEHFWPNSSNKTTGYYGICKQCKENNFQDEINNLIKNGITPSKICKVCKLEKSYLDFNRSPACQFGRKTRCRDCEKSSVTDYVSETKKCNQCCLILNASAFHKCSRSKDGLAPKCRECLISDRKDNIKLNPLAQKECLECKIIKNIEEFSNHILSFDGKTGQCKECQRKYAKNNRARIRIYTRERVVKDPFLKVRSNVGRRFLHALKGGKKDAKLETLLQIDMKDYKIYLELLFEPGMTWENYGKNGWQIDHVIPVSLFDPNKSKTIMFNYKNTKPRWATTKIAQNHGSSQIGNINKGKKILKCDISQYVILLGEEPDPKTILEGNWT